MKDISCNIFKYFCLALLFSSPIFSCCWRKKDIPTQDTENSKIYTAKRSSSPKGYAQGTIKFTCLVCGKNNEREYSIATSVLPKNNPAENAVCGGPRGCGTRTTVPLGAYTIVLSKKK